MDDNPRRPGRETDHELRDAMDTPLEGKESTEPVTNPIGCRVKWKGEDANWIPPDACDLL